MKRPKNNSPAVKSESGFTILELLASMTILLVMVGFLAVAFDAASTAWRQGEHDVDRAQTARATIDLMARDLAQAVVSPTIQFYGNSNNVAFVAPVNDDPNAADLAEVAYVLQNSQPPYRLVRQFTTATNVAWDVYSQPGSWPSTAEFTSVVSDAVISFSLTYFDTNNNQYIYWNSTPAQPNWTGNGGTISVLSGLPIMTNVPPAYINVHMVVTDSRTALLLGTFTNSASSSAAYASLTNRATRSFDAYVKVPQR